MRKIEKKAIVAIGIVVLAILALLVSAWILLGNLGDTVGDWDIWRQLGVIENIAPEFDEWTSYQVGVVTMRVPSTRISEESLDRQWEHDITRFESNAGSVSVVITHMVHRSDFMFYIAASEARTAEIARIYLHYRIAERMDTLTNQAEGTMDGISYYSLRGWHQGHIFEVRSFSIGYEAYHLLILVRDDEDLDLITQFFDHVRIGA